jgi:hypothetical protein
MGDSRVVRKVVRTVDKMVGKWDERVALKVGKWAGRRVGL